MSALQRANAASALGVVLAAAAVHFRSLTFGFVDLDDRDLIVDDQAFLVRSGSLLAAFSRSYLHAVDAGHPYYRPLVTVSYLLDARWSGVRPLGYHLTNVVLHAAASLLFLALLQRLSLGRGMALAGALVFAVHPALASAIAWIPGRNDSLLAVFALGAWLSFLQDRARASWAWRVLHVALFWLALATKETAVVIPLVCVAHVVLLSAAPRSVWPRTGAGAFIVAGWAAGLAGRVLFHPVCVEAAGQGPGIGRLLFASLAQILCPMDPSLLSAPQDLPVWPGVAAAGVLALLTWRAPGARRRVVALGATVFVLFLVPVLFLPGSLVLGSRLYLPACGAILMVAELAGPFLRERTALLAFTAAVTVVLAGITAAYESTFRDGRAFARGAVSAAPHSALAHFCLAQSHQKDGDHDRALAEYDIALSLGAVYVVHNNMAVIHMAHGRWAEAERELRAELAVDPGYARAYRNLAIVLRHSRTRFITGR